MNHYPKTKFQLENRPIRTIEVKCTGRVIDCTCKICGRHLKVSRPHGPNQTGKLGYTLYYADGSSRWERGRE